MQKEYSLENATVLYLEIGLSKKTVEEILSKLETLEKDLFFLSNKCGINEVSIMLETNTTYLSKIINTTKRCNFITYINQMRIEYTLYKIKTDPIFSLFKISAISAEVGFNNVESFTKAFHKKTGFYPSEFIKEQGCFKTNISK